MDFEDKIKARHQRNWKEALPSSKFSLL